MSIYRRPPTESQPSLVTTNTSQRRPIFTDSSACELLIETLFKVRFETGLLLLAFTVMPDHVHAIVVSEGNDLGRAMQLLKGRFARTYNLRTGDAGPVWQSRYHERTLRSEAALLRAVEYVHQNPVAAGLASGAEAYPWCTASGRHQSDLLRYLGQAEA